MPKRISRQGHRETEAARLVRKHGVRTPRRKVVGARDGHWCAVEILSCGHGGKSVEFVEDARVGMVVPCYTCGVERARKIESGEA